MDRDNLKKSGLHDLESAIGKLGVHDHLCLIYETQEEQFAAVIPYIKIGLERREKCIYVADDNTAAMVVNGMKAAGIDVATGLESGQLTIASKQEVYLKQGFFDPDWMIAFLKRSTEEAKAAGFTALRITGEMTWVLGGDPGSERVMEYEAKLNYFFPENDALAICQYNRTRFSPEVIKDVISTHPLVIFGGRVCKNFYYVPPDDLLVKNRPEREIDRLLTNIISRAKAEEDLRQYQERLEELARERTAEAEEAHHEKQQVFRTLVENSPDIIARYDRDCRRTYVNPVYLKTAQIPERDLLATAPVQISPLPAASAALLQNLLHRVLESGVPEAVDLLWPKENGLDHWYNVYASPEFDPAGKVISVMTISRDITDRKQAEEKIRKLNQELEMHVTNRTKQLEIANKELENFAYSISHDLRAPLRHIDGYVELLVSHYSSKLDSQGRRYMDTIAASARQMGALIDDLLQFSRTGRKDLHSSMINMNQLVSDILKQFEDSCKDRSIEWVLHDLPDARGDFALIRQVWVNLIDNAIKYTQPREKARIEIRAQKQENEIVYSIADNGVGFDMQYATKLFGVFQRLHSVDEFEGTGIGLATAHRIIARHGGRVWADARSNEGATFYFTLLSKKE